VGRWDNKRRLSTVPTETVTCIVIVTGAGGSRGSKGGFPSRGRAIFAFSLSFLLACVSVCACVCGRAYVSWHRKLFATFN